jgi:hypothetical protein
MTQMNADKTGVDRLSGVHYWLRILGFNVFRAASTSSALLTDYEAAQSIRVHLWLIFLAYLACLASAHRGGETRAQAGSGQAARDQHNPTRALLHGSRQKLGWVQDMMHTLQHDWPRFSG